MGMKIDQAVLEGLRKEYQPGCRVELVQMDDPYRRLKPGERGTVTGVDDIGTVHVAWDCGSNLGIAYDVDECRRIP
ncbi:DUF4314 domain-containing protein [Enterocloster clostridioformis]|uniref:DUF4314 domain-containing protein n=1 Tax=Enterocloster clostridioformis TaxID=1531 RepID=UPI002ED6B387